MIWPRVRLVRIFAWWWVLVDTMREVFHLKKEFSLGGVRGQKGHCICSAYFPPWFVSLLGKLASASFSLGSLDLSLCTVQSLLGLRYYSGQFRSCCSLLWLNCHSEKFRSCCCGGIITLDRTVQVMLLSALNSSGHASVNSSGHASVCSEQFRSCFCEQFRSCFCLLWTVQVMLLWTVQVMLLSALNSSGHAAVNRSGHAAVVELSHLEQIRSHCCGGIVTLGTDQVTLLWWNCHWADQVTLLWWNCHTWNRSGHTAVVELSLNRSGHAAVVEFLLWTVQIMLLSVLNSSDHAAVCSEQFRSCFCQQFRSWCCGGIVTLGTDQVMLRWLNCHWTVQVMLRWLNCHSGQFRSCHSLLRLNLSTREWQSCCSCSLIIIILLPFLFKVFSHR